MTTPSPEAQAIEYDAVAAPYRRRNDLLSFIQEVHRERGYLSPADIDGIAAAWPATVGEVYGIATFYSFLGARPLGKYVVKVCQSTPCCMKDCQAVSDAVQRHLGIGPGQMTADHRFSLVRVNCMGQCDRPPAMMVNDDVYQDMTAEKVRQVLERYSDGHEYRAAADKRG